MARRLPREQAWAEATTLLHTKRVHPDLRPCGIAALDDKFLVAGSGGPPLLRRCEQARAQTAHGVRELGAPFGNNSESRACHVACTTDGGVLLTDIQNHRILYLAASATEWAAVAGGRGKGSLTDQLCFPRAAAPVRSGGFYVADSNNHRVLRFYDGSPEGVIVAGGNGRGCSANQLYGPCGVVEAPNGGLLVADTLNSRVLHFPAGAGDGVEVAGPQHVNSPVAVAVSRDGGILVADDSRVIHRAPCSHQWREVCAGLRSPQGISICEDGCLLIADTHHCRVLYLQLRAAIPRVLTNLAECEAARRSALRRLGPHLISKIASYV